MYLFKLNKKKNGYGRFFEVFFVFKGVGGQGGQEARLIYTTEAI